MDFSHQPVLAREVVKAFDYLRKKSKVVFVDGTIGLGGHSLRIAEKLRDKDIKMLGLDKDPAALEAAKSNIKNQISKMSDNFILVNNAFEDMQVVLAELGIAKVDGILLDLGVSSMQLDQSERGFSFQNDARLDMRMNPNQDMTAAKIINSYPEKRLVKLFRECGEERFSGRIAQAIIDNRKRKEISTTFDLVKIILIAIPQKFHFGKTHPATNVFRALRMEVNQEVSRLDQGTRDCVELLVTGGRLAVITFHSIEDRIVKQAFQKLANPCTCPPKQPVCICGLRPQIKIINKRPIIPTPEEIKKNPRSRSAKLRVAEKIRN